MKSRWAIFLIVFLGIVLRLISLNQSFWLDDAAQATISSHNLLTVNWAADFQPPLFYVMTHLWQSFGIRSEWFLRLPSVFFGVATIYLTYYFFKKLFNEKVGLAASLLLATAPYHIYYSQEYRMYSFFAFLALLSWIFLWEKRWIWYGVTILTAVFTHYFAFLLIFSQFIFVLIFRRGEWRKYVTVIALSLIPFLLWFPVLMKQLQTASNLVSAWPRWREISDIAFLKFPFLILAKFTVGIASPENKIVYGFLVLFMAATVLFSLFRLFQSQFQPSRLESASQRPKTILLLTYCLVPSVLSWFFGLFIAANSPHRLLFILPAFYGIIAFGLSQSFVILGSKATPESAHLTRSWISLRSTRMTLILISIVFTLNIFFSFSYLFSPKYHREDWRGAVAYTDNKLGQNGVVLTEYVGPWAPMEWYSIKPERYIGASNSMTITPQSIQSSLDSRINNQNPVLLYSYLFEISDQGRLVEKYLNSKGYKLLEEKDFRGVGIIRVFSLRSSSAF